MPTITPSPNTLIKINKALLAALQTRLAPDGNNTLDIRFDLPDVTTTQANATLSIFLYDVHEDLQMRQSDNARYNAISGTLAPRVTHLNCNYLITYWPPKENGPDASGPDSQPDNEAIQIVTLVLQALLNNRQLPGLPGAWTRLIPPQENLNSLGNFWQSLGNRPRLSLVCSVTAPFSADDGSAFGPVKTVDAQVKLREPINVSTLQETLRRQLIAGLGGSEEVCLDTARLKLNVEPQPKVPNENGQCAVTLRLSGMAAKRQQERLTTLLAIWKNNKTEVTKVDQIPVIIAAVDQTALLFIDTTGT